MVHRLAFLRFGDRFSPGPRDGLKTHMPDEIEDVEDPETGAVDPSATEEPEPVDPEAAEPAEGEEEAPEDVAEPEPQRRKPDAEARIQQLTEARRKRDEALSARGLRYNEETGAVEEIDPQPSREDVAKQEEEARTQEQTLAAWEKAAKLPPDELAEDEALVNAFTKWAMQEMEWTPAQVQRAIDNPANWATVQADIKSHVKDARALIADSRTTQQEKAQAEMEARTVVHQKRQAWDADPYLAEAPEARDWLESYVTDTSRRGGYSAVAPNLDGAYERAVGKAILAQRAREAGDGARRRETAVTTAAPARNPTVTVRTDVDPEVRQYAAAFRQDPKRMAEEVKRIREANKA